MARNKGGEIFSPEIQPDLEHAPLVREEALDWLEMRFPGNRSFTTSEVLHMAGETGRRWLIARLRARNIGNTSEFNLPDTADALAALYLRSRGVKFSDAVEAVIGQREPLHPLEPRYGGVWNRLIINALDGLRQRVPARLLAAAVFAWLRNPVDQINCLVVLKRRAKPQGTSLPKISPVTHDYVYRLVLERPAPFCAVVGPSRELMYFSRDQLPSRSEVTSRHFFSIRLSSEFESYELLLGTMKPTKLSQDNQTLPLVSKILDIVFPRFESFVREQSSSKLETPVEPEQASAGDLQLWLTTQFLCAIYPGSLCEINETSPTTHITKVLASSAARPWELSATEPAKSSEMLAGYAGQIRVPLVVKKVDPPWTTVMEGIQSELRFLKSKSGEVSGIYSALALPILSGDGSSIGSLYMLAPRFNEAQLDNEVRILTIFSRIVGETIERQRSANFSAAMSANIVSLISLNREQFQRALLDLLDRRAAELRQEEYADRDLRLPFILISSHSNESEQFDPAALSGLKSWLIDTLRHLEWRSFLRVPGSGASENIGNEGFMGQIPGVGIMITPGHLVSKEELDRIRNAFPTTFNRTSPANSPVKLVSWVLDVSAQRIVDAASARQLPGLADEIEIWAFDVASLVDELAQSVLLRDEGEWELALKKIRQALQKPGARRNSYLRRLAADCSLALADWPGALKYAQEAVSLSGQELGSGLIRSQCLEASAYLCLGNPIQSWDLYSEAAAKSPHHPLPRYYRGQALLLIARLLRVYEDECRRNEGLGFEQAKKSEGVIQTLVNGALEDLTAAADLLERWGLIPEAFFYRNFHMVPTLLGQGMAYLLTHSPGPASSRLQSARRSFPKDDLFFREFLFAKMWEQGLHRQYASQLLSRGWEPFRSRLEKEFGRTPG